MAVNPRLITDRQPGYRSNRRSKHSTDATLHADSPPRAPPELFANAAHGAQERLQLSARPSRATRKRADPVFVAKDGCMLSLGESFRLSLFRGPYDFAGRRARTAGVICDWHDLELPCCVGKYFRILGVEFSWLPGIHSACPVYFGWSCLAFNGFSFIGIVVRFRSPTFVGGFPCRVGRFVHVLRCSFALLVFTFIRSIEQTFLLCWGYRPVDQHVLPVFRTGGVRIESCEAHSPSLETKYLATDSSVCAF